MRQPPLLAHETLARVLRLAKVDGTMILVFAGGFALLSAMEGDFSGALVGLLVAGAGAVELHGVSLLREGVPRGMNWLVGSQISLLISILAYCAVRLSHVEVPPIPEALTSMLDATAEQLGMSRDEYLRWVQRLALQIFAAISFFYQGGMAIYYYRRREPVTRALTEL
ncbi:MAG: hypothetical protein EXS43_06025 [Opitutus sp.]|nr:hypothetical protein [Opitutus sp.]